MYRRYLLIFLSLVFFLFSTNIAFAESSYVLPYPSSMPGSAFYKVNLVKEKIMKYWYYGDFGQFDYNLKQSDKYLVEAKTLFEYKQYLLGYRALLQSNEYFSKIRIHLTRAKSHGKNINEKEALLLNAAEKHIETLQKVKAEVPERFNWVPEKDSPSYLELWRTIDDGIKIREKEL